MKRFKKLVSVLTLTAMLAASLTACGGKDPVAEDDSTERLTINRKDLDDGFIKVR